MASADHSAASHDMDPFAPQILRPVPLSRWIGAALVALGVVWVIYQLLTNPGFNWAVVGKYMLHPAILQGVVMTLELTAMVMVVGIVIGVITAVLRMSGDPILVFVAQAYVWFFRGTPVLVQLVFWFNLAALFPTLALGIPFGGPKFIEISSTLAITSFTAAMLGLGLNEGAYMAEIVRGGLLSVDRGQIEASKALGYRPVQTFFRVVLPQAMTAIVPPTGNQFIGALKYTSLASVVGLSELMHSVELIYARSYDIIPMLIVASIWYLIMVSVLSVAQHFIERYYGRGVQAIRVDV